MSGHGSAAAAVDAIGAGAPFHKVSGSGNDFVAFDQLALVDEARPELLPTAAQVRALCDRRRGVGADGVVVLRAAADADYRLLYYNADGSRAELCGNASLCSVRLAERLGRVGAGMIRFHTDAGLVTARLRDGLPEVDLAPVAPPEPDRHDLREQGPGPDERRIGFARVGVPHLVILCADVATVDVAGRGAVLRHHPRLRDGANVNFVSRADGRWAIRTFERGVEAETLACGTGSVASALLLAAWSEGPGADDASEPGSATTELQMSTGLVHRVTLRRTAEGGWRPSLAGSARLVYTGMLGEGDW